MHSGERDDAIVGVGRQIDGLFVCRRNSEAIFISSSQFHWYHMAKLSELCNSYMQLSLFRLANSAYVQVQDPDADVLFKSSDDVLFKVYRKHLEMFSEGFCAPLVQAADDVVSLTEKADILELLFQFCYPKRQPPLESLDFETLSELVEAVEKYQVYSALQLCKYLME